MTRLDRGLIGPIGQRVRQILPGARRRSFTSAALATAVVIDCLDTYMRISPYD